jgi:hypothetical protein
MTSTRFQRISVAALAMSISASMAFATITSKSKDVIVLSPRDLPSAARAAGDSFFLRADGNGQSYLYEAQLHGKQLAIFDVTDPSHITLKKVKSIAASGPFDFIRPIGEKTELIRYRRGNGAAMLDLSDSKDPVLREAPGLQGTKNAVLTDKDERTDFNETYQYTPAVPTDFKVMDTVSKTEPELITTVPGVEHQLTNEETGTTFLLNRNGLTVVRRTQTEEAFKIHQQQLSSQ